MYQNLDIGVGSIEVRKEERYMSEFDKIIGYDDVKIDLTRYCDILKNPEKYMELGVAMPRGILLEGVPGIGKSLMAEAFAKESGRKVVVVRKDKSDGAFLDEIREAFARARKNPYSIVFLDDMDKFANEDECHCDAEEYVTVQACIDECRDDNVFVLATVNDKYCLPDSLIRSGRFDKIIRMRKPKNEEARKIIEHFLSQKKCVGKINMDEITKIFSGLSCAELETIVNEAAIYAGFDEKEKIEQDDLIKAYLRLIHNAPEFINPIVEKNMERVAVHEAGHALVSEILTPDSVSLISVFCSVGGEKGVVVIDQNEDFDYSANAQRNDVIRKLAGKAATEIYYGGADVGCRADIKVATSILENMIGQNCTSGFSAYDFGMPSEYSRGNMERMVVSELERCYSDAKKIIVENIEVLYELVCELMYNKTLTYKELRKIFSKK